MPHLMQVNDLTGSLVTGYRTLNVLGITPKRRAVLSHRLFSSKAPGFVSEPHEVQVALHTVSTAIAPLKERMRVTWILDTGFDDVVVWRTIWEQHEHVVCRLKHTERLVRVQDKKGHWQTGAIAKARKQLRFLGTAETMLVVHRGRQNRPKEQRVAVELWACRGRLRSATTVRREGAGEQVEKELWLLEVRLPDTGLEPWLLLTDWEVESKASAARVVTMERQHWAVEDSVKVIKECLGWEEVHLMDLEAVRMMGALGWVAAALLDEVGVPLEWAEVWVLARLGGWVPHTGRTPGKLTLTRGLRRLMEMLTTEAFLTAYWNEHGCFPPKIAAFLRGWQPPEQL